jgi:Sulfotransferase family
LAAVKAAVAPAVDRLAALGGSGRYYVIPEYRLMYVSVAKNACTALKWMMADLGGEDAEHFTLGLSPYTSRIDGIHDRTQWRKVARLGDLPEHVLAELHPDNGWLVFGVVRDPRPRCFSAWQNKLLLGSPNYTQWRREAWYPRFPAEPEAIREDFARFVDMLARNPDHPLHVDTHFRTQTRLLRRDAVPYSHIYDISEMGRLKADVTAHLQGFGWSGELFLPRSNETPLRATKALFADGVREQLEAVYASDFKRFGRRWDFADIPDEEWTADALEDARRLAGDWRRMAELRDIGLELRRETEQLRTRVAALETEPVEVTAVLRRRLVRLHRLALLRAEPVARQLAEPVSDRLGRESVPRRLLRWLARALGRP